MHHSDLRSQTNNTTNLSSFGTILCELGLCELGALARNSLLAVLVAARVPETHRKGGKDAKGNSQGRNWRLVIDTRYTESSFLQIGWLLVIVLRFGLFCPRLSMSLSCFKMDRDRKRTAPCEKIACKAEKHSARSLKNVTTSVHRDVQSGL
jgi:hypothetical protein